MKNLFAALSLVLSFSMVVSQECETYFDLERWAMQGTPDASWQLISSSDVINTAYIFPPTFFVGNEEMINVLIKGTMSVETLGDDDFIGVVFGYHKPNQLAHNNPYNFFLFDWKSETEVVPYPALEGFRLSYYNGIITMRDQDKYFWGRVDDPPTRNLMLEKYGDTLGWQPNTKYQFELLYTSNRIRIKIDDVVIFEHEGCFDAGKVGFYCMSQDNTRFEDFRYQYIVDFVPFPKTSCVDDTIQFISFDLACSEFPDFVKSMVWDFGDGHTSTEINPEHSYAEDGEYTVSLIVRTGDDCIDTVINTVVVKPYPYVDIGNDTTLFECSSITFDAGNPGSSYLWSTGETSQNIELVELSEDIGVWVAVNKNGCIAGDSVFVEIEPVQKKLFFPNAFTPDGDGFNDLFLPIGLTENVTIYQLSIFNRWGQQVFETSNPNAGWDGKYVGEPLQLGVYTYKVSYRIESSCIGTQDYAEQAIVTLVK